MSITSGVSENGSIPPLLWNRAIPPGSVSTFQTTVHALAPLLPAAWVNLPSRPIGERRSSCMSEVKDLKRAGYFTDDSRRAIELFMCAADKFIESDNKIYALGILIIAGDRVVGDERLKGEINRKIREIDEQIPFHEVSS